MRPQPDTHTQKTGRSTIHDLTCVTLESPVQPGQELFLTYGAHANARLFVEYGFVNAVSAHEFAEYPGEVLVDDMVESILLQSTTGSSDLGCWRDELEEQGYWLYVRLHCISASGAALTQAAYRDWSLHSAPAPAHPSYRLLTALRLAHVLISQHGTIGDWRDTLAGAQELVSEENERSVRGTLRKICTALISRADVTVESLEGLMMRAGLKKAEWRGWAAGNVKALWVEEKTVAEAVAESVDAGADF